MQVWCTYLFYRQNEHWRSIAEYCAPCSIGYNVILHFEKLKVTNNTENFGNCQFQYFPDDTFDKLFWRKKVKTQQKLWNVEGWGAPACWKWSPQDGRDAEATVEEHQQWRNSDFTDCSQVSMICPASIFWRGLLRYIGFLNNSTLKALYKMYRYWIFCAN